MAKYYYLAASMPYLKFGDPAPMTTDRFLEECMKWFSERDKEEIKKLGERTGEGKGTFSEAYAKWEEFDGRLLDVLEQAREARKEGGGGKVPEEARGITEQEDPLLSEKQLERARWEFIDGIQTGYYFDTNWLICYFLKLRILERLEGFNKDKGEERFYNLCEVTYGEKTGDDNGD